MSDFKPQMIKNAVTKYNNAATPTAFNSSLGGQRIVPSRLQMQHGRSVSHWMIKVERNWNKLLVHILPM
jgi:hypothetical protein